jgi:hypothetical protein
MKVFRFAGLLVIATALLVGSAKSATATAPVTCEKVCSGVEYYSECWGTLSQCCRINRITCPDPYVFESGDCTDGMNYCP